LDDDAMSEGIARLVRVGVVLVVAVLIPSLFVLIAGHNPWSVLATLLLYALGPQGWSEVLVHAIPLTLIGLGVAFALRAGLFNIGSDGQLIAGAVLAVFFAPYFDGWGVAGLVAFLILGAAGGTALGALVGYLRAWFGANEIIVTIMLNYVMVQMISFLIRGPMQETLRIWPQSYLIPADCFLPVIAPGTRLHAGLFVALAMVIVFAVIQRQTVLGFESSVLGANPGAAAYAGFRVKILTVIVMAISGGLAGLAGAVEVAGLFQRLQDNMAEGFGLAGIAVALIARLEPAAIPIAACLFGIFFAGSGALQRELALPFPLVYVIEAAVIFAVVAVQWALPSRKAVA
jgi:general nucleoside transport system permease protein